VGLHPRAGLPASLCTYQCVHVREKGMYTERSLIMWVAIVAIVAVSASRRYLVERERQRTLRAALERGQPIDPAVLQNLAAKSERIRSPERLQGGGVIVIAAGIGLAILGYFISHGSPGDQDAQMPLLGVGAMVACIGVGMLVAARLAGRTAGNGDRPDAGM